MQHDQSRIWHPKSTSSKAVHIIYGLESENTLLAQNQPFLLVNLIFVDSHIYGNSLNFTAPCSSTEGFILYWIVVLVFLPKIQLTCVKLTPANFNNIMTLLHVCKLCPFATA